MLEYGNNPEDGAEIARTELEKILKAVFTVLVYKALFCEPCNDYAVIKMLAIFL